MVTAETTKADSAAAAGIRVLIVDNEAPHAEAVAESLERVGYDCTVATSGPQGLKRIEDDAFDMVITDLVMNDVDGLRSCGQPRKNCPTPR